ncbi:12762_t:CDS:2 [Funneliformis caledonium]|uniref:alpha-amylase n=1 Tax=Funneliformis caledonium TaxID=1117310 RepID=A0A9N8V9V0_9GLOM|nr:12762_t:CDS:2 [Funneliformis caledonium]
MKFAPKYSIAFILATLILLSVAPRLSLARTAAEWRTRTIYQLLTDRFAQTPGQENLQLCSNNENEYEVRHYCGGTFLGIVNKLDYIKDLGFDAIWISPVVKQVEGETRYGVGWHGYWAQELYQINPHFGTADELKNLVKAAHEKDIWVMIDVVPNHMGPQDGKNPRTEEYVKIYNPFNKIEDYHFYCDINNPGDQGNVEYCSLGGNLPLPDLDTENPVVVSELNKWVKWLVKEFDFDGIRIDTAKHIRHSFWDGFTQSSGVFSIGEVADSNPGFVGSYQGHMDSTLGYPLFQKLQPLYTNPGANMYEMRNAINDNRRFFKDTSILGNFLDGHDQPRFNHITQDKVLFRNALTFVMLMDGIPIIYQGSEHDFMGRPTGRDPFNREALWPSSYSQSSPSYKFIANINAFRKVLPGTFFSSLSIEAWINEHIYAFFKDKALIITSNYGGNNLNINLIIQGNGRWPVGEVLINIIRCEEKITIDESHNVPVQIDGEPKVLYPEKDLKGLGICGL